MTPDDEVDEAPAPSGLVEYSEKARSYWTVGLLVLVLAAGFGFDLYLGGGVAHLPGWIIAGALVIGVDALLIHAARDTRSLVVTAGELWVGEEVLAREHIVGLVPGVERGVDPELPILGWPGGRPGRVTGVTVRLADGQDVVVPTRHPDRLDSALGVAAPASKALAAARPAEAADLAQLADIDARAEIIFRLAGYDLPEIEFAEDELGDANAIFVLDDPPTGFVWIGEVDALAYIKAIAVVPGAMRKGVGSRLLERACEWARDERYPAITLITYADVPWNGPYYAARGFVEVDEITPGYAALREREAELGLDDVGRRVVMRRELDR